METLKKIPMVKDPHKFINTEIFQMNLYIAVCRVAGDTRLDNDILLEWIKDNAAKFRKDFVMVHNA